MQRVVRAFPVLPGKEKAAEELARQMSTSRAGEAETFYRKFGIAHECWFAQHTSHGMMIIAITDFGDRSIEDAAIDYAKSTDPFEAWFKTQVKVVSGVDPSIAPLGPPTTCLFDWPARHA